MTLKNNELQLFAEAALGSFNLENISIDESIALSSLADDIQAEFEDLNSRETMVARYEYFKVSNTTPSSYEERLLEIEPGRKVIYGIRHMGGNREIPFIQLLANFKISTKEECFKIYNLIKEQFKSFQPLYLSLWSHTSEPSDFLGSIYMASSFDEISHLPLSEFEAKLSFEVINDDSYYDWYKAGYEEFHRECPELSQKVTVNSVEAMRDSIKDGLLAYVFVDGERVGLIAGERSKLLGHEGLYFNEIFISKNWKGKKLAGSIQRKFIRSFGRKKDFIWGTIDHHNQASYRTAFSNGRRPIRFECFVRIDEL